MTLPLPNLDTRRYPELVDEGRALVPRYAPGWTDENASDPGITLLELLAYLVEQDVYRANRVPERHLRKFLRLAGVEPDPPRAARAVVSLASAAETVLPAGTHLAADGIPFTSVDRVRVVDAAITAVQSWDGAAFTDLTAEWRAGIPVPAWGGDPQAAAAEPPALLLGFERPLPRRTLSLWLAVAGGGDPGEPGRVVEEAAGQAAECRRLRPRSDCGAPLPEPAPGCGAPDARSVVWEQHAAGSWRPLAAKDPTGGLLFDGVVRLLPPTAGDRVRTGVVPQPLHWIRCRLAAGAPDVPPVLTGAALNAVEVVQAAPARARIELAAGASLPTPALQPGERARLVLETDRAGRASRIARTTSAAVPRALVVGVSADAIEAELVVAGVGDGRPGRRLELPAAPVADGAAAVWSDASGTPVGWSPRADLDAAGAQTTAFALDAQTGVLEFGDGRRGRVPRPGEAIAAAYRTTLGVGGNAAPQAVWSVEPPSAGVAVTVRRQPAGGADAEDVASAAARAAERLWAHERLVELAGGRDTLDGLPREALTAVAAPQRAATALDFERLALDVPGTRVLRARAWPEHDPALPGMRAPGTVTVVIVNGLPEERPVPSLALLDTVERFLRRRKILGTRLVVTGPEYVTVSATAALALAPGADASATTAAARAALARFLHPLRGGPGGLGWPFGRDVFRSEVLALLDGVPGVDAVTALALAADGGEPACGNVCVEPTQLVVSGVHVVEVSA